MQLTIDDLRSLIIPGDHEAESPYVVGKAYLIRTVTMIQIGRLKWIGPKELVLEDASWVADTGRFHDALSNGTLNEIEPFTGDVIIGRGSIVDVCEWKHQVRLLQR